MTAPARLRSGRTAVVFAVAGLIALLCGANTHLVYVSLVSQPDCVPHRRLSEAQTGNAFAAANSSCSPSILTENSRSAR